MTSKFLKLGVALACASSAWAAYTPIALNPSSYNQDMVVEKTAQPGLVPVTTASIDGGTNNTGSTWYEVGFNPNSPTSGVPGAGTTWTSVSAPDHSYKMAPNYVNTPNAILIDTVVTNATWTFTSPAPYSALSFVGSGGNGGGVINVTVYHQDGTTETGQFNCPDWFGGSNPAWIAYGRVNAQSFAFDTQGSITNPGNPRWYSRDITLTNVTSPVTKVTLSYASGGANVHNGIFAVSGSSATGAAFNPIDVTGYNQDMIVEKTAPTQRPLADVTTATMDSGTSNSNNTWYEAGYNTAFPTTGLPAAGSTITNATSDHSYKVASSWSGPNAVFVDPANPNATITLATPSRLSAISFLAAAGNGPSSIQVNINHADGTAEQATISVPDWFNAANPVYTANGRVNVSNSSFANVNSGNPRVYGIDVPLSNVTSEVTSIDLAYASTGGRAAIFALSGTAGAIAPTFTQQPVGVNLQPGGDATLTVTAAGTEPVSFQWQKNVNGTFVNVSNGSRISGADTSTLTISGATAAEEGQYRVVASNAGGSATSSVIAVQIVSMLTDVTVLGDPITAFGGTSPAAETVDHAIDDSTSKYLNFGANGAAPFKGPAGFSVTPAAGRTIVTGLRLYTANDAPDRDPADYKLEGSNDGGNSYTVISSGPLSLPDQRNAGGQAIDPYTQAMQQVLFTNTAGYTTYRLGFANVKNNTNAVMQIGEVELLGVVDTSGAPFVATAPSNVIAVAGTSAQFTVNAGGTPAPSLQWQRLVNGTWVNITDSANVSGAQTATLTLNNITAADAGQVRVVVSNSAGIVTSAPATLTVYSSLADVTAPGDVVTGFGDTTIGAPNGPGATDPATAIDDTLSSLYRNGGSGFNAQAGFPPFQGPVGLVITPAVGATHVTALRIYTASGNPERDPADYKLEGSNDGNTWTVISSGSLALPTDRNATTAVLDPVTGALQELSFSNPQSYTSYRLTFNHVRDDTNANSLQVGEVELLGTVGVFSAPKLTIAKNGNGTLTITATEAGTLQSTTALSNNTVWTDVGPINGSITITPSASEPVKFYRLVK